MRLPPIAPLSRVEAKAARVTLPHFREAQQLASENEPFVAAAIEAMEAALQEYEGRPWWRRWLAPPAGHRTRLRAWMLEVQGYAHARLEDEG